MAWDLMRGEAEEGAAYLGEELGEHLAAEAAGAGQGNCTGGTKLMPNSGAEQAGKTCMVMATERQVILLVAVSIASP